MIDAHSEGQKITSDKFCPKCGAYIPKCESKCIACGWSIEAEVKTDPNNIVLTINGEDIACYLIGVEAIPDFSCGRDLQGYIHRSKLRRKIILMEK